MELLLFWVLCGVGAAVIASNKGNSGVAWFFVGVLLGPIGLILSLVVAGDPAVVERKKIEGGGYRRCDKCAELIRAEATKCRFCGSDVDGSIDAAGAGGIDGDQTRVGGVSNYDEFWKPVILGQLFRDELDRAANGEAGRIPLSGLRRYFGNGGSREIARSFADHRGRPEEMVRHGVSAFRQPCGRHTDHQSLNPIATVGGQRRPVRVRMVVARDEPHGHRRQGVDARLETVAIVHLPMRRSIRRTNSALSSMPTHRRRSWDAASKVVPEPAYGSSTTSSGSLVSVTQRRATSIGMGAG